MECEPQEKIRHLPRLTSTGDFGIVGIIEFDGQARKGEIGSETGQSAGCIGSKSGGFLQCSACSLAAVKVTTESQHCATTRSVSVRVPIPASSVIEGIRPGDVGNVGV